MSSPLNSQSQNSLHSQGTISSDWSDMIDNLESDFKKDLKDGDQSLLVERLHKAFDESLPHCPVDDLDTRIFSVYLSEASRIIVQLIAEINKKLSGKRINENDIKNKLRICENVLDCLTKCLKHLRSLQKVSISKIKTLPDLLFNVVKSALGHCKMSEVNYGVIIKDVSDEMTALFRKSNEVMNLFLTILDGVITFDVENDKELTILTTIISEIGDTATLVNCLDLKSLTDMWKYFGKLASVHGEKIRSKSPQSIIQHFASLEEDIMSLIFSAIKGSQQKLNEKKILCGKMLLKILDRLWSIYYLFVSDEAVNSAIKLLVQMHRYSPPCLIATKVDSAIVEFMERNISIELETLLNTIFKSDKFLQAFFEFGKREDTDATGYHLLTLSLIRKLLKLPYEIQRNWIIGEASVLDVAFTNIDLLQLELCLGKLELQVSRNLGEAPKSITLYEETFVMICGLVCQIPANDFIAVESVLVKHLMSGQFWSSLLTTDVWCLISRLGSSQLCYDHLKYLMKVHQQLAERENSLEVFILSFLISRLYKMLSEKKKDLLVDDTECEDSNFWSPLSRVLTEKGKSILRNRIAKDSDISEIFHSLNQKPSVKNWISLKSLLKMHGICFQEQDKQTMNILKTVWNSIDEVINDCEGIYLILSSELMMAMLHCENPCQESFSDGTLSSILKSIMSLLTYAAPFVRVKVIHWLKNTVLQISDSRSEITVPISELYARLLEDESPWVRQEALESFNQFTHECPNDDLVTRVVKIVIGKSTLSDSLPAYISCSSYYKLSGFSTTDAFLRQLIGNPRESRNKHTCYKVDERAEKVQKVEESSESDSMLEERVESVCNELEELIKYRNVISEDSLNRLRQTVLKVFDQRNNIS